MLVVLSCLVLPAQTIAASVGIAGLAYASKRRADGKDPIPFLSKLDQDKAEATEPAAA